MKVSRSRPEAFLLTFISVIYAFLKGSQGAHGIITAHAIRFLFNEIPFENIDVVCLCIDNPLLMG